jgi:hypothetical protein
MSPQPGAAPLPCGSAHFETHRGCRERYQPIGGCPNRIRSAVWFRVRCCLWATSLGRAARSPPSSSCSACPAPGALLQVEHLGPRVEPEPQQKVRREQRDMMTAGAIDLHKVAPPEVFATGCSLASRATRRFGCQRGWLRSNFVARRPDGTEDHAQRTGNPGNVG